eukprot:766116-Hanusia_phi.AAC.1
MRGWGREAGKAEGGRSRSVRGTRPKQWGGMRRESMVSGDQETPGENKRERAERRRLTKSLSLKLQLAMKAEHASCMTTPA